MSWFRINRKRFFDLTGSTRYLYCEVAARLNWGKEYPMWGVKCGHGQCVTTKAMLADNLGINKRSIPKLFKDLEGLVSIASVPAQVKGGRALLISAKVDPSYIPEGTTKGTTPEVAQPTVPHAVTEPPKSPDVPPRAPHVLEGTYKTNNSPEWSSLAIELIEGNGQTYTKHYLSTTVDNLRELNVDVATVRKVLLPASKRQEIRSIAGWVKTTGNTLIQKHREMEANPIYQRYTLPDVGPPATAEERKEAFKSIKEILNG